MSRLVLAAAIAAALVGASAAPVRAQMYRWTDEQGNPHYSQGLDSVPEPYRASATRLLYRSAPEPAPAAGKAGAGGETVVQFTPGQRIYVDARVNGSAGVRLILDTGADRTVITPRALVAAGVSTRTPGAAGKIKGATGAADVEAYDVESLQVGNARVGKMLVISHDIEQADVDGLLGRDFLDQFKVTIDNAAGRVTLSPK